MPCGVVRYSSVLYSSVMQWTILQVNGNISRVGQCYSTIHYEHGFQMCFGSILLLAESISDMVSLFIQSQFTIWLLVHAIQCNRIQLKPITKGWAIALFNSMQWTYFKPSDDSYSTSTKYWLFKVELWLTWGRVCSSWPWHNMTYWCILKYQVCWVLQVTGNNRIF